MQALPLPLARRLTDQETWHFDKLVGLARRYPRIWAYIVQQTLPELA